MDSDVVSFYSRGMERNRLRSECMLEEARSRQIIADRLPGRPCAVADIGGGPGTYSLWLAGQGHAVSLVDLTPLHIEQAKTASEETGMRLTVYAVADARELPLEDGRFDVVLLMGPLYHLVEREERLRALREAHRILRPGGLLFAAAISRYASVTDGFFSGLVSDAVFVEMMNDDVRTGVHRNRTGESDYFTTAYFHRPEDLQGELLEGEFGETELLAVESVFSYIPDLHTRWEQPSFRSLLLGTLKAMEADPSVVGFGGHLMAVGRKAAGPAQTPPKEDP